MPDKLSPSGDKIIKFGLFFMGFSDRPGLNVLSETGDHKGIESIGLGKQTERFGVVPNLSGIDDRNHMSGGSQVTDECLFVASGGFDDNEAGSGCGQLLQKPRSILPFIRDPEGEPVEDVDIEMAFGDIDANKPRDRIHVEKVPTLQIRDHSAGRRMARAAVRVGFNRPATIMLIHGLDSPRG